MKKSDLKEGMLVLDKEGWVAMVINNYLVSENDHNSLDGYLDNMCSKDYGELDIIAVSRVLDGHELRPKYWTEETLYKNLLWERKKDGAFCIIDDVEYSESTLRSLIKRAMRV